MSGKRDTEDQRAHDRVGVLAGFVEPVPSGLASGPVCDRCGAPQAHLGDLVLDVMGDALCSACRAPGALPQADGDGR